MLLATFHLFRLFRSVPGFTNTQGQECKCNLSCMSAYLLMYGNLQVSHEVMSFNKKAVLDCKTNDSLSHFKYCTEEIVCCLPNVMAKYLSTAACRHEIKINM